MAIELVQKERAEFAKKDELKSQSSSEKTLLKMIHSVCI